MLEEKTIQLRTPVKLGRDDNAVSFTEIKLREPMASELEKAQQASTSIGLMITLISQVAGIPRAAAEKLGQRDLQEAIQYLESFSFAGEQEAGQS